MPQARQRVWLRRLLLGALVVVGAYGVLTIVAGIVLRSQIERWATALGAQVESTDHSVSVGLLTGSASIHGLRLERSDQNLGNFVSGRIDTVEVRGVSIWRYFNDGSVFVEGITLHTTDLHIALCDGREEDRSSPKNASLERLSVGAFSIAMVRSTAMLAAANGGDIACRKIRLTGEALELDLDAVQVIRTLRTSGTRLGISELQWHTDAAERYGVAELLWSEEESSLVMDSVFLGPFEEPVAHSRHLPEERDVIKGTVQRVNIRGLDMADLVATGKWRAAQVDISNGELLVLRDKVLPDGPQVFKPLLSRMIRRLPVNVGVDTIRLRGMDIRYHERAEVERGYGKLHFAELDGLITGAVHDTTANGVLRIEATSTVQERAAIDLTFSSIIKDTTDLFVVKAHVAALGLEELNGVLGPLANIQATEGRMDTLILTMRGTNERASGNVHFGYTDLRLAQGHRPSEAEQGSIASRLINLIVRKEGRDASGQVRDGDFSFDRRKDRSMFNYLWLGLREGASAVLLPEVLKR